MKKSHVLILFNFFGLFDLISDPVSTTVFFFLKFFSFLLHL